MVAQNSEARRRSGSGLECGWRNLPELPRPGGLAGCGSGGMAGGVNATFAPANAMAVLKEVAYCGTDDERCVCGVELLLLLS